MQCGSDFGDQNLVGCSRNGQILGDDGDGNLLMYDPETGGTENFGIGGKIEHIFEVFNYRESLVSLKREMPIRKFLDDDVQNQRNRTGGPQGKVKLEADGSCSYVMSETPVKGGSVVMKLTPKF